MASSQPTALARQSKSRAIRTNPQSILSERRVPHPVSFRSTQLCVQNKPNPNHMTTNLTRIIPAVTEEGLDIDIPRSAWNDIEEIAQTEFGAELLVAFQPMPGQYLGGPAVPFAHYFLETTLDQSMAEAFIARTNPLIKDVVERYTQLVVPAER